MHYITPDSNPLWTMLYIDSITSIPDSSRALENPLLLKNFSLTELLEYSMAWVYGCSNIEISEIIEWNVWVEIFTLIPKRTLSHTKKGFSSHYFAFIYILKQTLQINHKKGFYCIHIAIHFYVFTSEICKRNAYLLVFVRLWSWFLWQFKMTNHYKL